MTPAQVDKLIFWLVCGGFVLLFLLAFWVAFWPVKPRKRRRGFDVVPKGKG